MINNLKNVSALLRTVHKLIYRFTVEIFSEFGTKTGIKVKIHKYGLKYTNYCVTVGISTN